jgi:hypothetical protein
MPCYRQGAGMTRAKGWRKIATAVWGWPEDPQVYGRQEFDAQPILDAIEVLRERTGARVTPPTSSSEPWPWRSGTTLR